MTDYEFTLRFALPTSAADPAAHVDALAAAGCDDALVGVGQPGRIALDFVRAAASAQAAVESAVADVRAAIASARLVEASPDYVGLTDVADLAGCSRQNMRKLMLTAGADFPPPLHDGSPALWHLADLLEWLHAQGRDVDPRLHELARVTRALNIAAQTRQLRGAVLPAALRPLFV